MIIKDISGLSLEGCRLLCVNNPLCQQYEYNSGNSNCFLENEVCPGPLYDNANKISYIP